MNKLLKQHFITSQEEVKTFIQLTLEVNKPIKELKIHKGTSHLSDQIIADLVAKEVFNNEDYIKIGQLKRRKIFIFLIDNCYS